MALIVLIKPFTIDLQSLIRSIPVKTNRFTQKCDCFQNHKDIFLFLKPIQDGLFWGCSRMGGQKGLPSLKSVTHILQ